MINNSHIQSNLPLKKYTIPIDENTVEIFHYDISPNGVINNTKPLGSCIDDSTVLYYDMADTATVGGETYVIDKSKYGNYGKITGATITDGRNGKALSFDGLKDIVEIPKGKNLLTTDNTISMWIYPLSWNHQSFVCLVGSRTNSYDGLMVFVNTTGLLCCDWGDGTNQSRWTTGYTMPTNQWIHLVITRDNSGRYLYINGNLQASTTIAGGPPTADTVFHIGSIPGASYYYKGYIDKVEILSRAISLDEVKQRYNEEICTLRQDGRYGGTVAIEEGTTNLHSAPELNMYTLNQPLSVSAWGGCAGTITAVNFKCPESSADGLTMKIQCTAVGTGGLYHDLGNNPRYTLEDGKTYTRSFWVYSEKTQNISGHICSSNKTDNLYLLGGNINVGPYWQKVSHTFTVGSGQGGSYHTRHILYTQSTVYVTCIQVEEKLFPTSTINGSRESGKLYYPKELIDVNKFTISCWFKIPYMHTVMEGSQGICGNWYHPIIELCPLSSRGVGAGYSICAGPDTSSYNKLIRLRNPGNLTGTTQVQNNVWYHLTATYDGSSYKVYVNGNLEITYGSATPPDVYDDTVLMVGGGYYGKSNCLIDELRIDKVARTDEEIRNWYLSDSPFYPKGQERIIL